MCCLSSSSPSTSERHLLFVSMLSCPADAKKIASVCSPFRGTYSALLATVIRFAFRFTCNVMLPLPFDLKRFRIQPPSGRPVRYGVKACRALASELSDHPLLSREFDPRHIIPLGTHHTHLSERISLFESTA